MQRPMNRSTRKQPDKTGIGLFGARRRANYVVLLSALVLVFCNAPALAQEPAARDLRAFYQQNCVSCHGPDGSAVDAEGKKLSGRDFTNPQWQGKASDDEMAKIILGGKFFGLAMPKFKDKLTADEAQRMVTEILRKSQKGQAIAPEAARPGGN